MKIIFMLAAKTYMYLPLFLAKEKGIFKSVFEAKRIKDDIEFRICDGDDDAIDSMLDFNRNARKCKLDEIAIAISDPTSILRQHKSFDNKTYKTCFTEIYCFNFYNIIIFNWWSIFWGTT